MSSWQGKYYHYENVEMYPKPKQDPLPVYIGGQQPERGPQSSHLPGTAHCGGMPAKQMKIRIAEFRELVEAQGRDFDQMDVAPQLIAYIGKTHEEAVARFQHSQMYNHLVSLSKSTLKAKPV